MKSNRRHLFVLTALTLLILAAGCSDRDPAELETARAIVDPIVWEDGPAVPDVYWQPFFETHYTAISIDSVYAYDGFAPDGATSLKFQIPAQGSALGPYTGGVITSAGARDLTDFNALTFYARTDARSPTNQGILLNEIGFGNDNTGTSLYDAARTNLALTAEWVFHVVPIPDPSKLIAERGLFLMAEGVQPEYPEGYNVWFDEIKYAKLGNIEVFRPSMVSANNIVFVGSTASVAGTSTIFLVDGGFVPVNHSPNYFDYISSNPGVAAVDRGQIRVIGVGETTITATLQGNEVNGRIVLKGFEAPTVAATPPTLPASDVISMFSGVYTNVPVDTWRTDWTPRAQVQDYAVAGDNTKMYTVLGGSYVGIEFRSPEIDASAMTHFHLDVLAPEGTNFRVKLVCFPPEISGDPVNFLETQDVVLDGTTTPAFVAGGWSVLDIPLADFQIPEGWDWSHVGQMVLSTGDADLVLVDNVYWHK